ncbi:N-acetyltransferase family protein [Sporolactobacillus sp. Y61]|uniref:N-acetyltransferase family protein n=1 Tax=Sporolactobacillus sp. Y61 TaxID=3160863 RepID=A0AAU8IES1_9BACL
MKNIHFRLATKNDLPDLVAIYNSTIPGRMVTADTREISVEDRKPWLEAHLADPRHPLWVAEREGMICGWLSLEPFYGRPAYHATAEISIYIHESCRHQGIGSLLIRKAMSCCGSLGISTLLAFIFAHNEPSLRLFEHFSFERWGFLPRVAELDGRQRDLVILGRRL